MSPAIYILLGVALGCVIGWLLRSLRQQAPDVRVENELRELVRSHATELGQERGKIDGLTRNLVTAQADLANERKLRTDLRGEVEDMQEKFNTDFKAISDAALLTNTNRFNEQSSERLEELLKPLRSELSEFKISLDTTRNETLRHSSLLKDQISRIGSEAANLSKALKGDVKVLGNWGENMLDRILEKSGLQRDIHYRRQCDARDGEGDRRLLDVIVDLPENRNLIIDSKVSLRSYEDSVNAANETIRLVHTNKLIEAIRSHFRGLGAKRYQDLYGINVPDFVLMYLPIEAAFFTAIAREPTLFAEAFDENVVLTTNSTLLATLHTVAHVWGLAEQQKNALKIALRGGKLYDKFVGFIEDLQGVGKALTASLQAWETANAKLYTGPGNLVRQAEELRTLGVKAAKALPTKLVEQAAEVGAVLPPALPPVKKRSSLNELPIRSTHG